MGILENMLKDYEEKAKEHVITISLADFSDASAEALNESLIVKGLVEKNPMLLLALADYSSEIGRILFQPTKDKDKDKEVGKEEE